MLLKNFEILRFGVDLDIANLHIPRRPTASGRPKTVQSHLAYMLGGCRFGMKTNSKKILSLEEQLFRRRFGRLFVNHFQCASFPPNKLSLSAEITKLYWLHLIFKFLIQFFFLFLPSCFYCKSTFAADQCDHLKRTFWALGISVIPRYVIHSLPAHFHFN